LIEKHVLDRVKRVTEQKLELAQAEESAKADLKKYWKFDKLLMVDSLNGEPTPE